MKNCAYTIYCILYIVMIRYLQEGLGTFKRFHCTLQLKNKSIKNIQLVVCCPMHIFKSSLEMVLTLSFKQKYIHVFRFKCIVCSSRSVAIVTLFLDQLLFCKEEQGCFVCFPDHLPFVVDSQPFHFSFSFVHFMAQLAS